jgi:hypothetical protein
MAILFLAINMRSENINDNKVSRASTHPMKGNLKFQADIDRFFSHIEVDSKERTGWKLIPFTDVIKPSKYNASILPRNEKVLIKTWSAYWDYFQIDPKKGFELLKKWKNTGKPTRQLKSALPDELRGYEETLCYTFIETKYRTNEKRKNIINAMGQKLFSAGGNRDPAYFSAEQFKDFVFKPYNLNPDGTRKFAAVSSVRCVIDSVLAALTTSTYRDFDIPLKNFRFVKGDVFDTTGLKNIGGKREDYLHQEPANEQLKAFVENIPELDTLVLHRTQLEGGGRISAHHSLARKNIFPLEQKMLFFEDKMKKRSRGYQVYKYFCKSTMDMVQQYILDANLSGKDYVFQRHANSAKNIDSFNDSYSNAGLRAKLWRWVHHTDPNIPTVKKFGANEYKVFVDRKELLFDVVTGERYHRVFYETASSLKGKEVKLRNYLFEGLVTTSHVVGKHTFASLSGQHGFSLEDMSEQVGTDTGTLALYYRGGGSQKLQSMVGIKTQDFIPWLEWVNGWVNDLYVRQYKKLKAEGRFTVGRDVLAREEQQQTQRYIEGD